MTQIIKIPGRIESSATGNVVTGANSIIDDAKGKKQNVINNEVDAELVRLDQEKQNNLTFDNTPTEDSNNPVTSGGVYAADHQISQAIEAILLLIPSAASALNKLVDMNTMNSSISTATALFKGTYNLVSDLHLSVDATHEQIAAALDALSLGADNNDYSYVQVPNTDTAPTEIAKTERYKFNGTNWAYEYDLNNSGFTSVQWNAINSGITTLLVSKLMGLPTNEALELALGAITQNIQNISAVIPSEATAQNQLADKAYVLTQILLATPSFKGQFTTLTQLEEVEEQKAGDLGIVRTKDTDGHDVFTFYQYLDDLWNEYFVLSYHPQDKPATTGWLGNYPYNGMGRVELPMNWVEGWLNDTWLYYPYNDVVYLMYYWNGLLYAPYNSGTQEGLGHDDNLVVKPLDYNIADIEQFVGQRYLTFTESSGVWTITKPDDSTITSTELNNTNIYNYNDPTHQGVNLLVQSMINKANTIYVFQYDYTLGEDVTVPANCILEFNGGSISGEHTITGQNTGIEAGLVKIFGTDVTLAGSWNVDVLNIKWFGAVGDGVTDDTTSFKNCIESPAVANGGYKILINRGKYCISDTIYVPTKPTTICGDCKNMLENTENFASCIIFTATNKELFRIVGGTRSITFENINFNCFKHTNNNWYQNTIALKFQPESTDITSSFNHTIRNCDFLGFTHCIFVSGIHESQGWQCDHMLVENCNFTYFSESGIYINSWNAFDFSSISNCSFTCHPMDDNTPSVGINVYLSGFFEIVQCAGSAALGYVSVNSDAYKYTTLIHLKGHHGTINIDGIQAESIENTVIFETAVRYNVIIQNSIIDAKLYVKNTINLQLQNDRINGNLVIGNGVNDLIIDSDNSLNVNKIICEGINYIGSIISLGNSTINLRDLAYLNGNTFNDLVNPRVYSFVQSESSELVEKEFPLIGSNAGNPYRVQFSILSNFYLGTFGADSLIEFGITWPGSAFNKIGEIVQNDMLMGCAAKRFDVSVNMAAGVKLVVKIQNINIEGEIKIESQM